MTKDKNIKQNNRPKTPKRKYTSKALRVFRIVKNVVFGVLIGAMVCLLSVTLIARMNGETPTLFGHTLYRVSSGSMAPYLQVGDIILCKECDPMTLKSGDVITYNGKSGEFAGKRVTHRVVKEPYLNGDNGDYYLVTKGDDNPVDDTPISTSQVTGKLVSKLDFLKSIYDFFLTPWGLLALIGLIVLAFFNEIINFVRAVAGYGDEKHEDIQDIIERVQRESAEQEKQEQAKKKQKKSKNEKTELSCEEKDEAGGLSDEPAAEDHENCGKPDN